MLTQHQLAAARATGRAIARDVLADDMGRGWTGLGPDDGDRLWSADVTDDDWTEAEAVAENSYLETIRDAERPPAGTATKIISVTHDADEECLIARCPEDTTLSSDTISWAEPITATSDSWAIAFAVTAASGSKILAIDHDGQHVHVTVDGSTISMDD